MKNEGLIDDDVVFGFLKNILNEFLKKYTRDFINKAPNFSFRDFVPVLVLKKEMHDFQKSKEKGIYTSYSFGHLESNKTFLIILLDVRYNKTIYFVDEPYM